MLMGFQAQGGGNDGKRVNASKGDSEWCNGLGAALASQGWGSWVHTAQDASPVDFQGEITPRTLAARRENGIYLPDFRSKSTYRKVLSHLPPSVCHSGCQGHSGRHSPCAPYFISCLHFILPTAFPSPLTVMKTADLGGPWRGRKGDSGGTEKAHKVCAQYDHRRLRDRIGLIPMDRSLLPDWGFQYSWQAVIQCVKNKMQCISKWIIVQTSNNNEIVLLKIIIG